MGIRNRRRGIASVLIDSFWDVRGYTGGLRLGALGKTKRVAALKSSRAPRWRDEGSRDAAGRWDPPLAVMLMLNAHACA